MSDLQKMPQADAISTMHKYERLALLFLLSLAIAFAQLSFAILWSRHDMPKLSQKYEALWEHDSQWYAHILEHGYRVNRYPFLAPGNNMAHIGFFPGYPAASYVVKYVTRLQTKPAMLLTSQIFTAFMWLYFFLILKKLKIRPLLQAAAVVTIATFPSAFFLIAAYSESMFICLLLGYLYWITSDSRYAWAIASVHGFLLSATRIVGIPLLLVPLMWMVLETMPRIRVRKKEVLISIATVLGAALFFLYCQATLGSWNAYSEAQAIGWGVVPNYKAILDLNIYRVYWPAISWDGFVRPDDISRISVPVVLWCFGFILLCELMSSIRKIRNKDVHFRLLCYAASGGLLFITLSGLWSRQMTSVIRYMLPVVTLLSIASVSMLTQAVFFKHIWSKRIAVVLFALVLALFAFIQAGHIDLFSFGAWVA